MACRVGDRRTVTGLAWDRAARCHGGTL